MWSCLDSFAAKIYFYLLVSHRIEQTGKLFLGIGLGGGDVGSGEAACLHSLVCPVVKGFSVGIAPRAALVK